jgi:cell division protein FtsA
MVVYYKNSIRFTKVIPVGGQLITNDIVSALQTPKSVAEDLKKKYGIFIGEQGEKDETITIPDMGSSRTVEIQVSKISPYIKLRVQELIKFVKTELEKEGIDRSLYSGGVILTGGSSLLKGIDRVIKEEMDLRVRLGTPLKEKIVGLYDIVSMPEYSTAIGLIDYYINYQVKSDKMPGSRSIFQKIWHYIKSIIIDNL